MVGRDVPGPRHLHRQPRLQSARRRAARRSRSEAAMSARGPLLEIEDLRVRFRTDHGITEAVRGVDFVLGREKLGIVGESGSGKSSIGRAILRLLPERAEITARRLAFG